MSEPISFVSKLEAIMTCKTVEGFFSNPIIDPVADYENIICFSSFEPSLASAFITEMLARGHKELVSEHIAATGINRNWEIAKGNPEFSEIFFENFSRALNNNDTIYEFTIKELNGTPEGKKAILSNWKGIADKTKNQFYGSRLELLKCLRDSEEGNGLLEQNPEELFYGNFQYSYYIFQLIQEKLLSREQIANLFVQDPIRMLGTSVEKNDDFVKLLEQMSDMLDVSSSLDPKDIESAKAQVEDYISQNFGEILERLKAKKTSVDNEGYPIGELQALKKWNTDEHKIDEALAQNYQRILENTRPEDTMNFMHLYSDIDIGDKNIDLDTIMSKTFSYIEDPDLQWTITRIAKELLEAQNLTPDQMQIYGSGHYSQSIKIGDYIFKIGETRRTPSIPYDERIIQPLIRLKLSGKDAETTYLEVQNLVDKDWFKGLSEEKIEEELYTIYSEMRDRGHRWTDVRKDNVGRLIKENIDKYDLNGQEIRPVDSGLGIMSGENKKILGPGELVIIDTDFIYEDNRPYAGSNFSYHEKFEQRYQAEKAGKFNEGDKKASEPPALLASTIDASRTEIAFQDLEASVNMLKGKEQTRETIVNDKDKGR